jgi:large subunit ribosomal protein L25
MSKKFELSATSRADVGKGASRRLRRLENTIPAVVYGANKPAQSITLKHNAMIHALEHEAFYSSILTLSIDGEAQPVLLKDLQRHPFKPKVLHADFLRVDMNKELRVNVPLHFVGTAVGVKQGGVVSHLMTELHISCLPKDLPEYIEVDVTAMELGDTLHVSHIKLPKGVASIELAHNEDPAVVNVHKPRIIEETPVEAEGAAAEGAEGAAAEGAAKDAGKETK